MTDTIIRLFILLAIFASIFLISQLALNFAWSQGSRSRAVNKRLALIQGGVDREAVMSLLRKNQPNEIKGLPGFLSGPLLRLQRVIAGTGTQMSLVQILLIMATLFVLSVVIVLVIATTSNMVISGGVILLTLAIASCIGILLPVFVLSAIATRRRRRVEQQFPIALDVFVRALKAGHPIASALAILTEEMEDPIGSEFGIVSDEVAYGAVLTDALAEMAERWDSDDLRMFVVSLSVQSETGGNLAEILENPSDVIRARASLFLKVRALSSEGRMTGWLLTALPIIAFVGMFSVNPEFYLSVAQEREFVIGFAALMVMYAIGTLLIRNMINIKV